MRLHIENIAKIEKADIEIDGITVIAGSNNTGKSTVGKVLFALFDAFYNLEEFVQERKIVDAKYILKKYTGNLDLICRKLSKKRKILVLDDIQSYYAYGIAVCESQDKIAEYILKYCTEYLQIYHIEEQFEHEEVQAWITDVTKTMIVNMKNYDPDYAERVSIQKAFRRVFDYQIVKRTKVSEKNANPKQGIVNIVINSKKEKKCKLQNRVILENDEVKKIEQEFTVYTKALYIENPRVIDRFSTLGYESDQKDALSKIEAMLRPNEGNEHYDDADVMNEGNNWFKENLRDTESNFEMQRMDEILEEIDKELVRLMNGTIEFEKKNSLLEFQDVDYLEPFRLNNLSTGLKAISLLQCILHYRVLKPKSVLILDEPEINLHPEWQVKYAQFIAFLQEKLDLHIVVTTHSPFFLKAIENASYEYGTESHCHYYYAENKDGDAVLECVDEDIESVYSKMMMPLFDMIADMGL